MLSGIIEGYPDPSSGYPKQTQFTPDKVFEENGILVFKVSSLTGGTVNNPVWFAFYSDNSNTFTLETNSKIYTFTKNGKIHGLTMNTLDESNEFVMNFMAGLPNSNIIKFNGIPIIKIRSVLIELLGFHV